MKKKIALLMAMVMLFAVTTAGTLAWLRDESTEVVNTFTVGDINIELDESDDLDLKMVPGAELEKDPFVTVKAGSEASYVFIQVTESTNLDDFITYQVIENGTTPVNHWTPLEGVEGVWYCQVGDLTAENAQDVVIHILVGDEVSVKEDVTKTELNALTSATYPTLTFKAYAVQSENLNTTDMVEIWNIAKTADA